MSSAGFGLTYDMWCPSFATTSLDAQYAAMLEQVEHADRSGFAQVSFNEHHGAEEGYLPSPLVATAAVAARTRSVALRPVVLAPLYDTLKLAEDVAVIDVISGGRMSPVLAAGYREEEFEMFGRDRGQRGAAIEEVVATLRRAWMGEPFLFRGRRARITPRPVQQPHPPIVLGGNSTAAAKRAARIADGFYPTSLRWWDVYRDECVRLGRTDFGAPARGGPMFVHVTEDPERDLALMAPYLLNAIHRYREWALPNAKAMGEMPEQFAVETVDDLRTSPHYLLLNVDGCVDLVRSLGPGALIVFRPMWGGFDPDLAWTGLNLVVDRVIPRVRELEAASG